MAINSQVYGGYLGEDLGERVNSVLDGLLGHGDDLGSVSGELVSQVHVHEVDLEQDVGEVEHLAEHVLGHVEVVRVQRPGEVVHSGHPPVFFRLRIVQGLFIQILNQHLDFAT